MAAGLPLETLDGGCNGSEDESETFLGRDGQAINAQENYTGCSKGTPT
jgi:hypothetical protein